MKVIISGSRNIVNRTLVFSCIKQCSFRQEIDQIISGCANGVDSLAIEFALENKIPYREFPADWKNLNVSDCQIRVRSDGIPYNARAGFNRNTEMQKNADGLLAIWDGISKGTVDMIRKMRDTGKTVSVFNVKDFKWLSKDEVDKL
jgi:hypothetical protein